MATRCITRIANDIIDVVRKHNGYYAPVEGVYRFHTPEDRNAFVQELDTAINEEKTSSNRKYSLDNSDNRRYSVSREVDSATLLEATRRAMRALAERYLPEKDKIRYRLRTGIKADVVRARREGKEIKRDELPTILSRITTFNATNESNGRGLFDETLAKLAAEIYYARRCFENDFGAEYEDSRGDTGNRRGEAATNAGRDGTEGRESEGAFADLKDTRPLIIDGEKDDAHKFWQDILQKEIDYSIGLLTKTKGHSIRQGAFSNARSMDELKAEVIEAFPVPRYRRAATS